jgi:beta-glucosidase-like glycosyl hydrolase
LLSHHTRRLIALPPLSCVSPAQKHFLAYDLESSDGTWRGEFNAILTAHDLVEYYLPAFRSAFQRAHTTASMCSYNAMSVIELGIEAVPSCADGFVINGIARGQWNWQGHVVSDCGAIGASLGVEGRGCHTRGKGWDAVPRSPRTT